MACAENSISFSRSAVMDTSLSRSISPSFSICKSSGQEASTYLYVQPV